ncbi:MAG: O-acetyl-ADP-ribose deacetylase [Candidatus Kapaibacteriota bacterium]|jgi:O-acetyl-ADP-ribose deacetylase (regulator of RNase III)
MSKIELLQGDITKLEVDAIVNAANSSLMGGGGVDGAIHRAAGAELLEECRKIVAEIGSCPPGNAVITGSGKLKCKYVIHAVGPIWRGGAHREAETLKNAYLNSLKLAKENGIKTIAFPNISTGVYGFPKELASEIAISTVKEFLEDNPEIEKVIFVCFDPENYNIYKTKLSIDE